MTAVPLPPAHLLTAAEYAELDEDEHGRWELVEGNLMMSPSPSPDHNTATLRLAMQLTRQLPDDFEVIPDVDVNLELAPTDQPGFVRRPDLVVVERAARRRVRVEGGLIRASEVSLVVEVVSPGSRRTDNMVKRAEYADAGIPDYWIIDLEEPVSALACRRTERFGYGPAEAVTGILSVERPFPVTLDLTQLC